VPDADLVTITIGGNDIEYLLTLLRCSYQADPDGAPAEARAFFATPVDPVAVDAALAGLPAKLAGLVAAVREGAPRARIVLVDYLTVVPDGDGGAALPMSEDHRRFCADVARRLAAATAEAADTAGADLVAASTASAAHHVGSAEPWVTGWEFGDVLAGGVVPYHPNAAGMRAVAAEVVALLRSGR
jgi:lysophospholipase L1-like esterase